MKTGVLFLLLATALISCETDENLLNGPLVPGTYNGIFYRTEDGATSYVLNQVSLELTSDRFSGASSASRYPAICHGTYSVSGTKIKFADECFWTTEFDWSLILSGEYTLSIEGNKVKMTRRYENDMRDVYELELQANESVQK
jgi:hypothetical protein